MSRRDILLCLVFALPLGACATAKPAPQALAIVRCLADKLEALPQTRAVKIGFAAHYRYANPVIHYEYQRMSGQRDTTWLEVEPFVNTGYYVHNPLLDRADPFDGEVLESMEMACGVSLGSRNELFLE